MSVYRRDRRRHRLRRYCYRFCNIISVLTSDINQSRERVCVCLCKEAEQSARRKKGNSIAKSAITPCGAVIDAPRALKVIQGDLINLPRAGNPSRKSTDWIAQYSFTFARPGPSRFSTDREALMVEGGIRNDAWCCCVIALMYLISYLITGTLEIVFHRGARVSR